MCSLLAPTFLTEELTGATILLEQSLSDFGDAGAILLLEHAGSRSALFLEAKVKSSARQAWRIRDEYAAFELGWAATVNCAEFRRFLTEWLPSFRDSQLARRFYRDFRNGLTHEARIKDGAEFSLHTEGTIDIESGIFRVNPRYLAEEVEGRTD